MLFTKAKITQDVNQRELANRQVSYDAACEAIVLLHNNGVLPLKNKKIALYGPGATKTIKGGTGSGEVKERYVVNILEGLLKKGFEITTLDYLNNYEKLYEEKLKEFNDYKKKQVNIFKVTEIMSQLALEFQAPIANIDNPNKETDTCIYVISRQAGEAGDRKLEKGDYYLSDMELANIKTCAETYKNFVLMINAGSSIDLSFVEEVSGIDAILYVSQLGMEMGNAIASVVSGEVNPSGKLTNTWVKKYEDVPFGDEYAYLNNDIEHAYYKEGIYVGYRYYDSFNIGVRYPFGYGLSYSKFKINLLSYSAKGLIVNTKISVKNIGSVEGKEVVQLYLGKPAKKLSNVRSELVAFRKTKLIKPQELDTFELSFNLADFSSYDEVNSCHILESGNYVLRVGNSLIDESCNINIIIEDDIIISNHKPICKTHIPYKELQKKIYRDTSDMNHLTIIADDYETVNYTYDNETQYTNIKAKEFVDKLTIKEMAEIVVGDGMFLFTNPIFHLPGAVGNTTSKLFNKGLINMTFCDGPAGIRLQKESGVNQNGKIKPIEMPMSFLEFLPNFVHKLLKANPKKDKLIYQYATSFPVASALGATWNKELMYQVGLAINKEMEEYGCTYWLAPAVNIQANLLCGRNFEYFSEDPYLSGIMASNIIKGVQSKKGYYATIKHFACNNQETNREHVDSILSERALREIYTKAFKICVTEANALSVMTSYNKLNGTYTPNSYDLCTNLLRSEWGFNGVVMTDWYASKKGQASHYLSIKAGNDLIMPGEGSAKKEIFKAVKNKTLTKEELFKACYNVVVSIFNSNIYQEYMEVSNNG